MNDVDTLADGGASRTRTTAPAPRPTTRRTGSGRDSLIVRQVQAIDAWTAARAQREQLVQSATLSRDERLDVSRRLDVLRRAHQALLGRTGMALAGDTAPMRLGGPVTAVLTHRHAWTLDRLTAALQERGVEVITRLDNGAEALGVLVAEQPDVLFTGDRLAMMSGDELLREAALFAPHTLLATQTTDDASTASAEEIAHLVLSRQHPIPDMADALVTLAAERAELAG